MENPPKSAFKKPRRLSIISGSWPSQSPISLASKYSFQNMSAAGFSKWIITQPNWCFKKKKNCFSEKLMNGWEKSSKVKNSARLEKTMYNWPAEKEASIGRMTTYKYLIKFYYSKIWKQTTTRKWKPIYNWAKKWYNNSNGHPEPFGCNQQGL